MGSCERLSSMMYENVSLAFEEFINTLTHIQDSVQVQWEAFKAHRDEMERKVKLCAEKADSCKIVSLDIGGSIFKATEETLLREPDSFFYAMLHSGQWKPDEGTGNYFIDRSPKAFDVILEYLRCGQAPTSLTPQKREVLQRDIDFYGIHSFPGFGPSWNPAVLDPSRVSFADHNHTCYVHKASVEGSPSTQVYTEEVGGTSELIKRWRFTAKVVQGTAATICIGDAAAAFHNGKLTPDRGQTWNDWMTDWHSIKTKKTATGQEAFALRTLEVSYHSGNGEYTIVACDSSGSNAKQYSFRQLMGVVARCKPYLHISKGCAAGTFMIQ
eukprot:TRINITY_DN33775_c0_g1_i1.p1 TRINITY_DN33775_c0_g1~~TRINITY_DN33775_c0_g1_i1.p1  ORF type:complete len:327 (-),score=19.94 TRINITY_DN33775_c0_g1_i1:64-1044(-)